MKTPFIALLLSLLFSTVSLAVSKTCYLLSESPLIFTQNQKMCIQEQESPRSNNVTFEFGMQQTKIVGTVTMRKTQSARCLDCNQDVYEATSNFLLTNAFHSLPTNSVLRQLKTMENKSPIMTFNGERLLSPDFVVQQEFGTVTIGGLLYCYRAIL